MGGKADRRELPGKASVKKVTRKPKGVVPEIPEPPKNPKMNFLLGQSGKRKKGQK